MPRHFFLTSACAGALPLFFFAGAAAAQTPTSPPPEPPPPAPLAPLPPPYVAPNVAPSVAPDSPAQPQVVVLSQGGAPQGARAREEEEAAAEETPDRSLYLSISPLHLLLPVIELTAEARLSRNLGVSVLGGYGSVRPPTSNVRFDVWEVGGQFTSYPVGHFDHGMQLGIEAVYLGVSGNDSTGNVKVAAAGTGFAAGPFLGYKLATKVGFTFNVQGGVEYVIVQADAKSSTGATSSAEATRWIPLVNANVGWSF